jgi:chromosome segregation ATPase
VKVELRALSEALKELQNRKADTEDAAALPRRQLGEVKNRLRQLDDVRNQRVRTLAQKDRNVMQAYEWVEANRGRFKNDVYGPILAEVNSRANPSSMYQYKR